VTEFIQSLTLGLLLSGVYAVAASGLTLIFGVMKIINIAHGAFLILAAYLSFTLWSGLGIDPIVGIVITAPVSFGIGWIIYKVFVQPVRTAPMTSTVLLTFGLALVLEAVMGVVWGNNATSIRPGYVNESFIIGGIFLPKAQVYGGLVAVVILGILGFILTKTWLGRAVRAAAVNPGGAELVGIKVATVAAFAFALGAGAAGAGGAIVGVLYPFVPGSHYLWIARLLAIVVLGGLGNLKGAILGGILFGLGETLASTYVSPAWATAVPYLLLFIVLLIRPQGILGSRLREDAMTA
jgi:branched-chain amino acid transport system permease protein